MSLRLGQEIQAVPRQTELSDHRSTPDTIDVIVGIVTNARGEVLIGRRQAGTHMAGLWEFPGGKFEADEPAPAALERELAEELGIAVISAEPLTEHHHDYPDRSVRLDVWWVLEYRGTVEACEGQALQWADVAELPAVDMLPADAPIIAAIRARLAPASTARA
jgi:8-oxo-dGTP diphosphatase